MATGKNTLQNQRPPTQRDVASHAGVSQAAVSYALNGKDGSISRAARRRVLASIEELGYSPNPLARVLRGSRTALLGVIARDLSHPVLASMLGALSVKARQFDHEIVAAACGESPEQGLRLAGLMKSRLCDGLLIVGDLPDDHGVWEGYRDVGLPLVALLQGSTRLPVTAFCVDNVNGARTALEHLVGLGHTRIAFVTAGWIRGSQERLEAYQVFAEEHRLEVRPGYVAETDGSGPSASAALERLLRLRVPPTAVFAANDIVALGLLAHASRCGLRVPEQLSVVGFDDIGWADSVFPSLTTLRQPIQELADAAVGTLVHWRDAAPLEPSCRLVRPELVVRQSSGPCPSEVEVHNPLGGA